MKEYKVHQRKYIWDNDDVEEFLNAQATDGWELVGFECGSRFRGPIFVFVRNDRVGGPIITRDVHFPDEKDTSEETAE